MIAAVSFWVEGTPRPQGSKRHVGNGVLIESSAGLKAWRHRVRTRAALAAHEVDGCIDGPVRLTLTFYLQRPASQHVAGDRNRPVKARYADARPTTTPDLSKLLRAVEDAITDAGLWRDDSIVVEVVASKVYADRIPRAVPGVEIRIRALGETP